MAQHRAWGCSVVGNGESWPRVVGPQALSSSDIYRLGIIPTYALTAPTTTASGTSTAGTYGIVLVYRSTLFSDGLTTDNIQGNGSNVVDVTLTSTDAAVLTKVVTTDTKVDKLDIYAAQKIGGIYGAYYRVVKDCANSAGTVTFNIQMSATLGLPVGTATSSGTIDNTGLILATDNDYPNAQPIILEVAGRMVSFGGIIKRVTATFTNGSSTVTTSETIYDGIEFWYFKRDTDTTGGLDSRGTYLARYATATTLTLVNVDGTADTYDGTTGSGLASIWQQPNRSYSKLLNPHAHPEENITNDYPSAGLAAGKVPNTNRVLLFGANWTIAEDYDRLPLDQGLNYISTEYGCSSHFSIIGAHGRLYWLDFGKGKREILMSDGTAVTPISTQKIKSILDRLTFDSNGDVWRVESLAGIFNPRQDTLRWGLYLDGNTSANYVLELDLSTGDLRADPQFYGLRYQDVFTYGMIRGRNYIGQYGWTGGIARIGLDDLPERYRDWVSTGTLSGSLATAGQTTTVLTIASGTLDTASDGLKGIQALVWQESTAGTANTLIANRTYYHCRISANTATTFTVNYVETMSVDGTVSVVGTALPNAPSGLGWNFAIGVIQGILGPKFFTSEDTKTRFTVREIAVTHQGHAMNPQNRPVTCLSFENFDSTPRDAQYFEATAEGQQISDTAKVSSSFARPKTNPVTVAGFAIHDNLVNTDTVSLNIETITIDWNTAMQQGQ